MRSRLGSNKAVMCHVRILVPTCNGLNILLSKSVILIKAAFGKQLNIKTNDKKLLLRFVIIATTSSGKLAEKM